MATDLQAYAWHLANKKNKPASGGETATQATQAAPVAPSAPPRDMITASRDVVNDVHGFPGAAVDPQYSARVAPRPGQLSLAEQVPSLPQHANAAPAAPDPNRIASFPLERQSAILPQPIHQTPPAPVLPQQVMASHRNEVVAPAMQAYQQENQQQAARAAGARTSIDQAHAGGGRWNAGETNTLGDQLSTDRLYLRQYAGDGDEEAIKWGDFRNEGRPVAQPGTELGDARQNLMDGMQRGAFIDFMNNNPDRVTDLGRRKNSPNSGIIGAKPGDYWVTPEGYDKRAGMAEATKRSAGVQQIGNSQTLTPGQAEFQATLRAGRDSGMTGMELRQVQEMYRNGKRDEAQAMVRERAVEHKKQEMAEAAIQKRRQDNMRAANGDRQVFLHLEALDAQQEAMKMEAAERARLEQKNDEVAKANAASEAEKAKRDEANAYRKEQSEATTKLIGELNKSLAEALRNSQTDVATKLEAQIAALKSQFDSLYKAPEEEKQTVEPPQVVGQDAAAAAKAPTAPQAPAKPLPGERRVNSPEALRQRVDEAKLRDKNPLPLAPIGERKVGQRYATLQGTAIWDGDGLRLVK